MEYMNEIRSKQFSYLRVPMILMTEEFFKCKLSPASKLLYGLLLSRMTLSCENGEKWLDENNNVFINYSNEEIMRDFGVSINTATKYMKELEGVGLIEKKKMGQGKVDCIYVKDFATYNDSENITVTETDKALEIVDSTRITKNCESRVTENCEAGFAKDCDEKYIDKSYINNKYINKKNIYNINQSENTSKEKKVTTVGKTVGRITIVDDVVSDICPKKERTGHPESTKLKESPEINTNINYMYDYKACGPKNQVVETEKMPEIEDVFVPDSNSELISTFKDRIHYNALKNILDDNEIDLLDEIVGYVVNVFNSPEDAVFNVNKKKVPKNLMAIALKRLTEDHIVPFIKQYANYEITVRHRDKYILAALYNSATAYPLAPVLNHSGAKALSRRVDYRFNHSTSQINARFNNYEHRQYDYEAIEKMLLGNVSGI